ncbi:hypothetical protein [Rubrivirga sp. IMCC43871]|uniref:hypothetical protein n=1 Tax=Rubrivirga sp. IMCC43871 TaxID=3391575 RepID=UPI00398F946B
MMHACRRLLWIDCAAGALVGAATLGTLGWLSELYLLPREQVLLIGGANLTYAAYSFALAIRPRRPLALLVLLVLANATWAVLCARWAVLYADTASAFGLAHLVAEAVIVGGLAAAEWRCRGVLRTAGAATGTGGRPGRPPSP